MHESISCHRGCRRVIVGRELLLTIVVCNIYLMDSLLHLYVRTYLNLSNGAVIKYILNVRTYVRARGH